MDKKIIIEKIKEWLKVGSLSTIIISIALRLIGYLYMTGQLRYFSIDKSFYELNLFNDFSFVIMSIGYLLIPLLAAVCFVFFVKLFWNNRYNFVTFKKWLYAIFGLTITYISLICLLLLIKYYLKIDFTYSFKIYNIFILIILISVALFYIIKRFISILYKSDAFDYLYTALCILITTLILLDRVEMFGYNISKAKTTFMFLNSEYVVLYNTSSEAIVTKYSIDYDKNIINIYTDTTNKTTIIDKDISYRVFAGNNIIHSE